MKQYLKGKLPPTENFKLYRKRVLTQAVRIDGPFLVQTAEGSLTCQEGYLALDASGNPYPIAAEEFVKLYEPAE